MFDVFVGTSVNQKIFSKENPKIFNDLSTTELLEFRANLRNQYNTIIVGGNTIKNDNPNLLNNNELNIRIIIDKYGDLDLNSKIFTNHSQKTYLILLNNNIEYIEFLKKKNVNVILLSDTDELNIIETIKKIAVGKVLIEGGAKTISFFLKYNCIKTFKIIKFPLLLSNGINLFDEIKKNIFLELKDSFLVSNKFLYEEYEIK